MSKNKEVMWMKVEQVVESLPPVAQDVLSLRFLEGLSVADCADVMEVAEAEIHTLTQKSFEVFTAEPGLMQNLIEEAKVLDVSGVDPESPESVWGWAFATHFQREADAVELSDSLTQSFESMLAQRGIAPVVPASPAEKEAGAGQGPQLAQMPAKTAQPSAQEDRAAETQPWWSLSWLWPTLSTATALAVLLVVLLPDGQRILSRAGSDGGVQDRPGWTAKGGPPGVKASMYLWRLDAESRRHRKPIVMDVTKPFIKVNHGDRVRLRYQVEGAKPGDKPWSAMLVVIDARGRAQAAVAQQGKHSVWLKPGEGQFRTFDVTALTGAERWVMLVSREPFMLSQVQTAVSEAYAKADRDLRKLKALPGPWHEVWAATLR